MQDKIIAAIGAIELKKKGNTEPHTQFIENMFPNKDYSIILAVFEVIKRDEMYDCSFQNVDIETVSNSSFIKYGYRKGSSRGGDITFSTKCGDLKKKLTSILTTQFPDFLLDLNKEKYSAQKEIFTGVYNCFKENSEYIIEELLKVYSGFDKKQMTTTGFSFLINLNGERKYLNDFQAIKDLILFAGTEGKSFKHNITSEGTDNLCSICNSEKTKIHGFASPFKYYTVDKPGFASNFFNQAASWKNYPICSDCAANMEEGKNFVYNNLKRSFYGKSYFIIPRPVIENNTKLLQDAIKVISSFEYQANEKNKFYYEDLFLKYIAKAENYFNIDLLFFEEDPTSKAITIKLMVEEIFPSRFRTIFQTVPDKINTNPIFKNSIYVKKEIQDLTFYMGILKTFFEDNFYDVIYKVFLGTAIDNEFVMAKIMSLIRSNYNDRQTSDRFTEPIYWTFLKAVMVLNYFQELGILSYNKNYKYEAKMNNENPSDKESKKRPFDIDKLHSFISNNPGLFDQDYKIGVFAVGILVRLLLNIQQRSLSNTPFEKKLRGYKLNPELLKNIYLEALEKISQYHSFYAYMELREFINKYFTINSYMLSKISNNELSFYFVAGLEMGNNFKTETSTLAESNEEKENEIKLL